MSGITTHVLDPAAGRPAAGLSVPEDKVELVRYAIRRGLVEP